MPNPIFHNHEFYSMIKNGLRSIDRQFVDTRNQQTNNYQLYKQDRDELNNQFKQNANNLVIIKTVVFSKQI